MNILFITKRCIESHGGFDRIAKLAERDHNVHVLGTRVKGEPSYEFSKGVSIHRCNSLFSLSQLQYPLSFPILFIRKLTKKFDIDVIHSFGLQATNTVSAGISARLLSSIPLVLSIEGASKTTGSAFVDILAKSYDLTLGNMLVKASKKVIVLGKALVERALKLGASIEKITICPPSVDIERFDPDGNQNANLRDRLGLQESFVVGFVGRFVPLKGIFDLIIACKIVSKEYPLHLLLVGDGPLKEKILRTTHSLGIPSTATGWVSNPELYYSAMDIFVLPSHSEGFPHTCLEAMAMKKPIVVTDVGASKELVEDGRNGFVVAPKNPKILALKIREIIKNEALAQEWGRTNRRMVKENYAVRHQVEKFENIYEQAMGEPKIDRATTI